MDWADQTPWASPPFDPSFLALEVFNVGSWLTHGDLALEAKVDFHAVVEHRLIPARVRSEWDQAKGEKVLGSRFGLLPVRIPPTLVMLVLVLSA